MAIPNVTRDALPFYQPRYTPDTSRLASIIASGGRDLALLSQARGNNQAEGLMRLASILSGGLEGMRADKAAKVATAIREQERADDRTFTIEREDRAAKTRKEEREAEAAARTAEKENAEAKAATLKEESDLRYEMDKAGGVQPALYQLAQKFPQLAARFQIQDGAPVLMNPAMARQSAVDKAAAEDKAADNIRADRQLAATLALRENSTEKPSVWVSKGDQMRFVTPTQASAMSAEGWRSGNTREQGRPVNSGDANRLADFDTSLNELEVLDKTVSGSTGTSAKIGASLPNWVTNLTGRGVSAKQKQASIDRVKQVIGKALEGGVLRKEDEVKYEKILPTIYDEPQVVASKLQGLRSALNQRRQTLLENLSDAGFDVTRFSQGGTSDAAVDALIKKYGGQ